MKKSLPRDHALFPCTKIRSQPYVTPFIRKWKDKHPSNESLMWMIWRMKKAHGWRGWKQGQERARENLQPSPNEEAKDILAWPEHCGCWIELEKLYGSIMPPRCNVDKFKFACSRVYKCIMSRRWKKGFLSKYTKKSQWMIYQLAWKKKLIAVRAPRILGQLS